MNIMKKYLIDYYLHTQCKNKLHEAVNDYLKRLHRLEVLETDIPALEIEILQNIEALNKKFPRCKGVQITPFDGITPDQTMYANGYMFLVKLLYVAGDYQ